MVYSKFNSNLDPKAAVEALAFNADALAAGIDAGQITSIDIEINGRPVRFDVLGYDIDKVTEIHRRKAETPQHFRCTFYQMNTSLFVMKTERTLIKSHRTLGKHRH